MLLRQLYDLLDCANCDDYELQIFYKMRNTGWLLTDKARQTNIWKEESEKKKRYFKNVLEEKNEWMI